MSGLTGTSSLSNLLTCLILTMLSVCSYFGHIIPNTFGLKCRSGPCETLNHLFTEKEGKQLSDIIYYIW